MPQAATDSKQLLRKNAIKAPYDFGIPFGKGMEH